MDIGIDGKDSALQDIVYDPKKLKKLASAGRWFSAQSPQGKIQSIMSLDKQRPDGICSV